MHSGLWVEEGFLWGWAMGSCSTPYERENGCKLKPSILSRKDGNGRKVGKQNYRKDTDGRAKAHVVELLLTSSSRTITGSSKLDQMGVWFGKRQYGYHASLGIKVITYTPPRERRMTMQVPNTINAFLPIRPSHNNACPCPFPQSRSHRDPPKLDLFDTL